MQTRGTVPACELVRLVVRAILSTMQPVQRSQGIWQTGAMGHRVAMDSSETT